MNSSKSSGQGDIPRVTQIWNFWTEIISVALPW